MKAYKRPLGWLILLLLLILAMDLARAQPPASRRPGIGGPPAGSPAAPEPRDCQAILEANPGAGSGYYSIDPDGDGGQPPLTAYCDMVTDGGGWTVIDYQHDAGWQPYFGTWQTIDDDRAAMPTGAGFPSPSHDYWVHWFLPADMLTRFRASPGCQEVESSILPSVAYVTSGNFYGCKWYNTNCPMDPASQECYVCTDPGGQPNKAGTCSHRAYGGPGTWDGIYEGYPYSCSFDWWNRAPSLGIAGKYCVAYRLASDLALAKSGAPEPVLVGEPLTYTLVVANLSAIVATGVVLTDTLPPAVALHSATASQGTCSGSEPIRCEVDSLAGNTALTVTVLVTPTAAGIWDNRAQVTSDEVDANPADNRATEQTTVALAVTLPPTQSASLIYTDSQQSVTSLQVGAGAVTTTTLLIYTPRLEAAHALSSTLRSARHIFNLDAYRNGQHLPGLTFQKPATLTVHYSDGDVQGQGLDEDTLRLYYWDGSAWSDGTTTCTPASSDSRDPANNVLSLPICHISQWNMSGVFIGIYFYLPLVSHP